MSDLVHTIYHRLTQQYGTSFTIDQLCQHITSQRGKPIVCSMEAFPVGLDGVCWSLRDVDLVFIRERLEPHRRKMALLHELSHLLLGHVTGHEPATLAEFTARYQSANLHFRQHGHMYSTPVEYEAELCATMLFPHVSFDPDEGFHLQRMLGYQ